MNTLKTHESIDELSDSAIPEIKALAEEQETLLEEKTAFSDSELFIRKAFEESPQKGCEMLFRRYHKILCSHAVRFVYSKELAEDIVSEVFCRFWKTKAYQTVTSSYRFYLFRCVRNEAYNHIRSEFKQLDELDSAINFESSSGQRPDSITQFEEVFHQVEELVESLSPQCRKAFLLNRFEGKKYQEVANELNISIKTVEVHIGKALSIIRKGLKEHWLIGIIYLLIKN